MTIILIGDSGSGKSTIENELSAHHGFKKIISCTTRKPREGEVNGKDYWFISNDEFEEMIDFGIMAEYEKYSQDRFYGTLREDYCLDGNNVVVLTPNGYRQLKKNIPDLNNAIVIYVETSLGNRIIRYIKRCGVDKFNFDDKNEICSRVERDFGMFMGIKNEVDFVVDGNKSIEEIVNNIKTFVKEVIK